MSKQHVYKAEISRLNNAIAISLTFDGEFVSAVIVNDSSMAEEIACFWEQHNRICVEIVPVDDEDYE